MGPTRSASNPQRQITVLHIAEADGAGVLRALESYVRQSPGYQHHALLLSSPESRQLHGLASAQYFSGTGLRRVGDVRRAIRSIEPDVVHAHASWAGVYARIVRSRVPVIYQPHAFAFEDSSRKRVVRIFFWLAERLLARHTARFAALSPREHRLIRQLDRKAEISEVPNVAAIRAVRQPSEILKTPGDPTTVVTAGRVAPQKDPEFFAAVAQDLAAMGDFHAVWIGDGDPRLVRVLERAGVTVTGWLTEDDVAQQLSDSDVYVHTAAYEGLPIAILNAATVGLPVVVRNVPSLENLNLASGDAPQDVARLVARAIADANFNAELRAASATLTADHSDEALALALRELYELAAHPPEHLP